jgi:hypothetical protein
LLLTDREKIYAPPKQTALFQFLGTVSGRILLLARSPSSHRTTKGSHMLTGGSRNNRSEAKEWISLFMHEVLVRDN